VFGWNADAVEDRTEDGGRCSGTGRYVLFSPSLRDAISSNIKSVKEENEKAGLKPASSSCLCLSFISCGSDGRNENRREKLSSATRSQISSNKSLWQINSDAAKAIMAWTASA